MAPKRKTTRLTQNATPNASHSTHTTTSVTNALISAMINEGVTAALAACDVTMNGDDSHTSGTGARRPMQVARECTYPDLLKCQPLNFKGTEGVVGLTQWKCSYWWNSHVKTTTPEAAHAMQWKTLKVDDRQILPRGELEILEFEMWNLKVKGINRTKFENYVGGLPDTFLGDTKESLMTCQINQNQQPNKRQNLEELMHWKCVIGTIRRGHNLCVTAGVPKCLNTEANQRACYEVVLMDFKKDCQN
ncbi:hypothetical protein Tco_0511816 [Tanacetum coccineum]